MRSDKILNSILDPKATLTVMCVAAAFYSMNGTVVANVLIIVLALCAAAFAFVRYCSTKMKPVLYIAEVLGLALYSGAYVVFYNKTIQENEINALFLLCALILLLPFFVEIGLQAKKADK